MTEKTGGRPPQKSEKDRREERLAEALRANLKRRKAGQGKPLKPAREPGGR
jgi:hypothetical protein